MADGEKRKKHAKDQRQRGQAVTQVHIEHVAQSGPRLVRVFLDECVFQYRRFHDDASHL